MNCPVCDSVRMREVERDGVMIDVCPQCKGVWLDRGELDKLMSGIRQIRDDFNAWHDQRYGGAPDQRPYDQRAHDQRAYDNRPPYGGKHYDPYYHKKKKKKTLLDTLGDLFD